MKSPNKKIYNEIEEIYADANADAFLSYCAYNIRWNMIGDYNSKLKNKAAIRKLIKEAAGEVSSEVSGNQHIGEGSFKLAKKGKY